MRWGCAAAEMRASRRCSRRRHAQPPISYAGQHGAGLCHASRHRTAAARRGPALSRPAPDRSSRKVAAGGAHAAGACPCQCRGGRGAAGPSPYLGRCRDRPESALGYREPTSRQCNAPSPARLVRQLGLFKGATSSPIEIGTGPEFIGLSGWLRCPQTPSSTWWWKGSRARVKPERILPRRWCAARWQGGDECR